LKVLKEAVSSDSEKTDEKWRLYHSSDAGDTIIFLPCKLYIIYDIKIIYNFDNKK
jgi:hypothetical protein